MNDIYKLTDHELDTITGIATRAFEICKKVLGYSNTYSITTMTLVIAKVHLHGCKLDLDRMLVGADRDLIHDISGIINNYDGGGKLKNCFLPRFAL